LKVNFHKSLLVGVNVANSWLEEAFNVLYNRGGIVPFKYFGHLIGSNPCQIFFWNPLVEIVKSCLSWWKCCNLHLGGWSPCSFESGVVFVLE
jgi:hypothetical protein